jgi:hypothetical protein
MKSAGTLEDIRNFDLVRKITAYYSLTHHLDKSGGTPPSARLHQRPRANCS